MNSGTDIPVWDLSPIYNGFDDPAFRLDKTKLKEKIVLLQTILEGKNGEDTGGGEAGGAQPGRRIEAYIHGYNEAQDLAENLSAYAYAAYSTNTEDIRAMKEIDGVDEILVSLKGTRTDFRNLLASADLEKLTADGANLAEYRFFLEEELFFQKHQLSKQEEELAADLNRSGAEAWSKLQDALSSQIRLVWEESTGEEKTAVELRSLAFHKDRNVRRKAFTLELQGWERMKTPLAFSLNGVKGASIVLNKRRGYGSALEVSVRQSRISEKALDALLETLKESLPDFRRYFKAKAGLLGVECCAFFDIFAPVGAAGGTYTFAEARSLIEQSFADFSKDMASFASMAFDKGWIDARPRPGKIGGAYCTDLPLARESRILCNFNGTFYAVKTIAHELGHAYHHHVIKEETHIHKSYPMTLAETASIFAETLVTDKALSIATDEERLSIVESMLQDEAQVIVDILSRFLFEREVFERRSAGDLSAEELCAIMTDAQKQTYGDGLDETSLHPYMWAVKSHYYRPDLAFYNFPYAFGLLLGLSLFASYKNEGPAFAQRYRDILLTTGKYSAVEVTARAGFTIEDGAFWRRGMDTVRGHIETFLNLAHIEE